MKKSLPTLLCYMTSMTISYSLMDMRRKTILKVKVSPLQK